MIFVAIIEFDNSKRLESQTEGILRNICFNEDIWLGLDKPNSMSLAKYALKS